jgi:hypothetical protein
MIDPVFYSDQIHSGELQGRPSPLGDDQATASDKLPPVPIRKEGSSKGGKPTTRGMIFNPPHPTTSI